VKLQFILEQLQLTSYERRVILALVAFKSLTANELCKVANTPQGRIYSVLRLLETKGFVQVLPTSPKKYAVPQIKFSLKRFLEQKKEQLSGTLSAIETVELPSVTEKYFTEPSVAILNGREEHIVKILEMQLRAKKEICRISPLFRGTASLRESMRQCCERGVSIKIIIPRVDAENRTNVKECGSFGVQIRVLDDPRAKFSLFVCDRVECLIGTEDYSSNESRMMVYSRNPALIANLSYSFETLWKMAKPWR